MTPFPLTPTVDTAPAQKPDRQPSSVREKEDFVVPAIEQVTDKPQQAPNSVSNTANMVTAHGTDAGPNTSAEASVAALVSTPGQPATQQVTNDTGLFQSLTATPKQNFNGVGPATPTAPTETTIATLPAAPNTGATTASTHSNADEVTTQLQPTEDGRPIIQHSATVASTPVTNTGTATAETVKPASGAVATPVVSATVPQSTRTPTAPQTTEPVEDVNNTNGASTSPVKKVAAITAGESGATTLAQNFGSTISNLSAPQSGALANNPQLLAQALASTGSETSAQAIDLQTAKSSVSAQVVPDTPTVTQSFHSEMRAALDAPTQAAAYTAKGAVTAQPAAEQVALQISRAANQGVDKLTIQLKPAELGKIKIDLEVGPDNRLIAVIAAEKSETLDLLQRDARQLERALNDAGLKTDSGSLEFNLRGDGDSADRGSDDEGKLMDGAVMLPGDPDNPYSQTPHAHNPLILPEGRIDIQV